MGYIIPTWELAVKAKQDYRKSICRALLQRAIDCWSIPDNNILIRDLRASDVGLLEWRTPSQLAHATVCWINHQAKDRIITLSKIVQLSEEPAVTEISIGGYSISYSAYPLGQMYGLVPLLRKIGQIADLDVLQVQYGLENLRMEGWFSTAHMFSDGDHIRIDIATSEKSTDGDELVLVGFVAEKPSG